MTLLNLEKKNPCLAPKNSSALMCNTCSCLVYMPPVSDFAQTAPQSSRLASVYIVVSVGSFFKRLMAVITLFSHQVSTFLERSEIIIFASKSFLFCWRDLILKYQSGVRSTTYLIFRLNHVFSRCFERRPQPIFRQFVNLINHNKKQWYSRWNTNNRMLSEETDQC